MAWRSEVSMRGLTYKTHAGSLEPFTSCVKQKARICKCGGNGIHIWFKLRCPLGLRVRLPSLVPTNIIIGGNATKSASLVVGDMGKRPKYCAGRLTVGRQTHYLETTCNSFVRTHLLRQNSRRGWILRFNYHRLPRTGGDRWLPGLTTKICGFVICREYNK